MCESQNVTQPHFNLSVSAENIRSPRETTEREKTNLGSRFNNSCSPFNYLTCSTLVEGVKRIQSAVSLKKATKKMFPRQLLLGVLKCGE